MIYVYDNCPYLYGEKIIFSDFSALFSTFHLSCDITVLGFFSVLPGPNPGSNMPLLKSFQGSWSTINQTNFPPLELSRRLMFN